MKIGIIGAGMVGGALTKAFAKRGHQIIVASSDPTSSKMTALIEDAGANAKAGTANEASAFGDIVILATPWPATKEIIENLGDLSGKIVIDATNPIATDFSGLEDNDGVSGGELVQHWAADAYVVKTLNQIGFDLMDAPQLTSGKPVMFLAGEDGSAKETVAALIDSLGFDADDAGAISMSHYLEALGWLWINRAIKQGKGRNFAFVLGETNNA